MLRSRRPIPRLARYTWARQRYGVGLIGLSIGILSITPFLVKRSLGGGDLAVPLLIAIWQAPWIFAPSIQPLLARLDPQRAWRWIGVLAHAPLLFIALVPVESAGPEGRGEGSLWPLLVAIGLYHLVLIAYMPHRGALIRTNYAPGVRGRMYGLVQIVTLLGSVAMGKVAAQLLDADARYLKVLYPLGAVLGAAGFWVHGRIRWRHQRRPRTARTAGLKEMWRILKTDRAFRLYEVGFMVYGIAFLLGWPLLYIYAEGPLDLSYDQMTDGQAIAFPAALILGAAIWGRLADRLGVVAMTAVAFLALAVFFGFMPVVGGHLAFVAGFALFGFAMAGVDVGWSIGPLHFAQVERAHMYSAVHFSLVGVRSAFAPFVGFFIADQWGYPVAFACSATLLVLAALIVWRLARSPP